MAVDCSPKAVRKLLDDVEEVGSAVAAALSKVAAKAEGAPKRFPCLI